MAECEETYGLLWCALDSGHLGAHRHGRLLWKLADGEPFEPSEPSDSERP